MDASICGEIMSDWIPTKKSVPERMEAYDVTVKEPFGGRLINVAIFRPNNSTWELLIDKHNYADCKVIAWKPRSEPYQGLG